MILIFRNKINQNYERYIYRNRVSLGNEIHFVQRRAYLRTNMFQLQNDTE